ncbi:MAG: PEP-CTERM sorting domain-containing protein [Acetobacteraceae bacterium]
MFRVPVLTLCAVGVVALGVTCAAPPAKATFIISYPAATPASAATDVLSVNGSYTTPLPAPLAPPFAASAFGLTLDLPAQASYSPSGSFLIGGFSLFGLSGSYTDGGQTETFTDATAQFGNGSFGSGFYLTVANLLQSGDLFTMQVNTSDPLFTQTANFEVFPTTYLASFTTGPFTVTGGSADYTPQLALDPSGTINTGGSGQINANGQPVPEPGSLALLFTGLIGFAAVGSLRRRIP